VILEPACRARAEEAEQLLQEHLGFARRDTKGWVVEHLFQRKKPLQEIRGRVGLEPVNILALLSDADFLAGNQVL
jgi:hypothetical protein